MSEINFKDFFIDNEEIKEEEKDVTSNKRRSTQKASYSFQCNGCDCIVTRETTRTKKYLVLLVSHGQYYIKDENGGIEDLNTKNYVAFFKDFSGTINIDLNWTSILPRTNSEAEYFIELLMDKDFQKLATNNLIFKYNISAVRLFKENHDFYMNNIHLLLKIKEIMCRYYEENDVKEMFFQEMLHKQKYYGNYGYTNYYDLRKDGFFKIRDILFKKTKNNGVLKQEKSQIINPYQIDFLYPDGDDDGVTAFQMIFEKFSEEIALKLIERLSSQKGSYIHNSNSTIDGLFYLILNYKLDNEDADEFFEYLFNQSISEGYDFFEFCYELWMVWKQQLTIYGEIISYMPDDVSSIVKRNERITDVVNKIASDFYNEDEDLLEKLKKNKELEFEKGGWRIIAPKNFYEIILEEMNNQNSLSSLIDEMYYKDVKILFLRPSDYYKTSYYSLIVKNNDLVDIVGYHGENDMKFDTNVVKEWCEANSINYDFLSKQ